MPDTTLPALEEIRADIASLDALIKRLRTAGRWMPAEEFNVSQDRLAAHTRTLLALADEILALHTPEHTDWGDVCSGCWSRLPKRPWPCPTVQIARRVLGQGKTSETGDAGVTP